MPVPDELRGLAATLDAAARGEIPPPDPRDLAARLRTLAGELEPARPARPLAERTRARPVAAGDERLWRKP